MIKKKMKYGYKFTKSKGKDLFVYRVLNPMSAWRAIKTAWVLWRNTGMWSYLITERGSGNDDISKTR